MATKTILFSVEAGVARLTLNRPDRLNSFTAAMHGEVAEAMRQVDEDPAIPQPVTLRTRKFIRNPLLGRKQMVV